MQSLASPRSTNLHYTSKPLRQRALIATKASKQGAVVIGGGPAGLATALALQKSGWSDITVVERQADVKFEDVEKSYVYQIDGRGRRFLDMIPGLTDRVKDAGVETRNISIVRSMPTGEIKRATLVQKDTTLVTHWLPRRRLMAVLESAVVDTDQGSPAGSPAIRVVTNADCTGMRRVAGGAGGAEALEVDLAVGGEGATTTMTLRPSLLVAADGLKSKVRETLATWEPSKFSMVELDSPAAGLRFKVMQLPPNPPANKEGKERLTNPEFAVIVGQDTGPTRRVRWGLLPVKDPNSPRPANIVARADHEFFKINTAEGLYKFLEESFPQFPVRNMIPLEKAQAYAASKGGRFPKPQYCPSLAYVLKGGASAPGVVLVGDAAHAFPPDLGQGVNSALEDVSLLWKELDAHGHSLSEALPAYEAKRIGDVRALIELMTFGAPYQYSQDKVGVALWNINFVLRTVLSKLWSGFRPAFAMVQDANMSYSQILATSKRATQIIQVIAVAVAVAVASGAARASGVM